MIRFPSMSERGGSLGQHLKKSAVWNKLKQQKTAIGEYLKPYAFRDSYSLRGHSPQFAYSSAAMADAMGHNESTHSNNYVWASDATTAATFAQGMKATD